MFREFISKFEEEFRSILFEMARRTSEERPRFPIWDEHDQRYYKYIIDNAPEGVRNDRELLRKLIQQAMFWRYGDADRKGVMHDENIENMPDLVDRAFNIQGFGKFSIKQIPMYPKQLIGKFEGKGDWKNPHFGYNVGNWMPFQKRALHVIDAITENKPLPEKEQYYNPSDDSLYVGASAEAIQKARERQERGGGKKKNKDIDEFTEKSLEAVPLDDDDKKFLDDFKAKYLDQHDAGFGPLFAGQANENIDNLLRYALALRYSDHYVRQDQEGNFHPREEYRNKNEPDGVMYAPVHIPFNKGAHVDHVYMNIPALVKKFDKYKKSRNFVKEPLLNHNMSPESRRNGVQAAERWLDRGTYKAQQGVKHGEILFDLKFYDQIKKDHDLWRKSGGQPVRGNAVSPELEKKLTWRQGDMIVQSPDIADAKVSYDPENMSWDDLIQKDATTAVNNTIKILKDTRFKNVPNFEQWAKNSENFGMFYSAALTALTTQKTGVDPETYRSQKARIRMAGNVTARAVIDLYRGQGTGEAGKDDDAPPSATDTAAARGQELNVNTGKAHHRTDEPEKQTSIQTGVEDDDDVMTPQRGDEPSWHVGQQQKIVLSPPKDMSLRVWRNMSRDQKITAMLAANMISAPQGMERVWQGLNHDQKLAAMRSANMV